MKTSKIAVFTSAGKPILINEVEIPVPGQGEILVKNEYSTLCRSDLNTFCGKRTEKTPTILGHEIVGRIVAFGPGAPAIDSRGDLLSEGNRITWAIYASEPDSEMARKGIPQKAPGLFKYGHEKITAESNLHGGLSEFTLLRINTPVSRISEEVPVQVAATVNCAVSTVAGALRLSGNVKGKKVLVSGAGMLGIVACAMCKASGASAIVATDIVEERLETAKVFGASSGILISENIAETVMSQFGNPAPFDVVIELSGIPESMEKTLELLTIGGIAVWVGAAFPSRKTEVDAEKIVRNLLTIKGLHNYNEDDFIGAVNFIEQNHHVFPFTQLINDHFVLDQVNEAFDYAINQNPHRTGIRIN